MQKHRQNCKKHDDHIVTSGATYAIGDRVLLQDPTFKIDGKWKFHLDFKVPFHVVELCQLGNYLIEHVAAKIQQRVHFNRLKPAKGDFMCYGPSDASSSPSANANLEQAGIRGNYDDEFPPLATEDNAVLPPMGDYCGIARTTGKNLLNAASEPRVPVGINNDIGTLNDTPPRAICRE